MQILYIKLATPENRSTFALKFYRIVEIHQILGK
jgi:hypothetical protein